MTQLFMIIPTYRDQIFSLHVSVSWTAPRTSSRTYRAAEEVRAANGKPGPDWSQVGTDPRISLFCETDRVSPVSVRLVLSQHSSL